MAQIRHKIVKKTRIEHVKCYLRKHYIADDIVLYYTISATDGSFLQTPDLDMAINVFEQLVAFEKSQTQIKFE